MMLFFVLCASILLFVFVGFFVFFSLLIFISGPVLGQVDQLCRFLPWSASRPPSQGWWLMALKSTNSGKRVFNCSYSQPDTLSIYLRYLYTQTFTYDGTNICKRAQGMWVTDRVDKVLFVLSAASAELHTWFITCPECNRQNPCVKVFKIYLFSLLSQWNKKSRLQQ